MTKVFEFRLKFALDDHNEDPEQYVERLGEAGCDDAIVGIGKKGRIALDFSREAESALDAVISAVQDVKQAIPDARLIEATPDIVNASDIADVIGCSRQYILKLVNSIPSFPEPLHEGKTALWHLANILDWFQRGQSKVFQEGLVEVAQANMRVNIEKEQQRLDKENQPRIELAI